MPEFNPAEDGAKQPKVKLVICLVSGALSGMSVGFCCAIVEKIFAGGSGVFLSKWFFDYSFNGLFFGVLGGLVMALLNRRQRKLELLGTSGFWAGVSGLSGLFVGFFVGVSKGEALATAAVLLSLGVVLGAAFGMAFTGFSRLLDELVSKKVS